MAGVTLSGIDKSFGNVKVLHDVSLEVADGEFVVFVGPSGCGKSTLLRIISGLDEQSAGTVLIGGRDVSDIDPADRQVAMVFQSYALYPHMTVAQNLGFGLRMGGTPRAQIAERIAEAARILGLEELMERKPRQLSGGQRQRVAIGRAIVRHPAVFLFDEPLSNLDAELRVQMRIEIARLHQRLGTTMIFVTHDQVEAMTLADRIVVLRDGRIEQQGSPVELYENPHNRFVASFIGSPRMNFLRAEMLGQNGRDLRLRLPDFGATELTVARSSEVAPGPEVLLGIRPEHFLDAEASPIRLTTRVQVVEQLGGVSYVHAAGSGAEITVERRDRQPLRAASEMQVGIDPSRCYLFDPAGARL